MARKEGDRPKIYTDPDRIVEMMKQALSGREKGVGIFAHKIVPPEIFLIERLKSYERKSQSEAFALHALFFISSTMFADNSTRQLNLIKNKFNGRYAWLFKPDLVTRRRDSEVIALANNLIRPGYNRNALPGWKTNATVLVRDYKGDIRNFFANFDNSAPVILNKLTGKGEKGKKGYQGFIRFGPKLGRLYLQWVQQYGLHSLENIDEIGIPVDWQVARLVLQTGGIKIEGEQSVHKHWILDKNLTPLLTTLCQSNGLSPQEVSETLWLIGNRCCNKYQHNLCPLESLCDRMISREPLDKDGLFDPRDTGRWEAGRKTLSAVLSH